jgi:hypothetical protein
MYTAIYKVCVLMVLSHLNEEGHRVIEYTISQNQSNPLFNKVEQHYEMP